MLFGNVGDTVYKSTYNKNYIDFQTDCKKEIKGLSSIVDTSSMAAAIRRYFGRGLFLDLENLDE